MGYLHIENLYKNQDILLFKECYVLEKIHGTSANVAFDGENKVLFHPGGAKMGGFVKLFNEEELLSKFKELFNTKVVVYGEAYGGSQQKMSGVYGKELKFVVFDIKVDDNWLDVPNAEDVANKLGLEFVAYAKVETNTETLNTYRDASSVQAERNDCGNDKIREGIVLRPLIELTKNNGDRVISKHKRDEFMETNTKREVSPEKLKILEDSQKIAEEWVTPMRLKHVLDKVEFEKTIEHTGEVIKAMIEDVHREAKDEIIINSTVDRAIGRLTAKLYKQHI